MARARALAPVARGVDRLVFAAAVVALLVVRAAVPALFVVRAAVPALFVVRAAVPELFVVRAAVPGPLSVFEARVGMFAIVTGLSHDPSPDTGDRRRAEPALHAERDRRLPEPAVALPPALSQLAVVCAGDCSASWSFLVSSSDSEVLMTVPPYCSRAAIALSSVICSITMNSAEVPGFR